MDVENAVDGVMSGNDAQLPDGELITGNASWNVDDGTEHTFAGSAARDEADYNETK